MIALPFVGGVRVMGRRARRVGLPALRLAFGPSTTAAATATATLGAFAIRGRTFLASIANRS
ncbi:MAG: hypothetical protein WA813_18960, partial [Beijerinckiaceae bacterium]